MIPRAASRTSSPVGDGSRTMMRPALPLSHSPERPTLFIKVSSTRFAPPSATSTWAAGADNRPLASSVTSSSRSSARSMVSTLPSPCRDRFGQMPRRIGLGQQHQPGWSTGFRRSPQTWTGRASVPSVGDAGHPGVTNARNQPPGGAPAGGPQPGWPGMPLGLPVTVPSVYKASGHGGGQGGVEDSALLVAWLDEAGFVGQHDGLDAVAEVELGQ